MSATSSSSSSSRWPILALGALVLVLAGVIAFLLVREPGEPELLPLADTRLVFDEADIDRLGDAFPPDQVPDSAVLLIGDGMGFNQIAATRIALEGPGGRLFLERFPAVGWSWTHSARSLYTDSAAGATAFATGVKTTPRTVGLDVDGEPVRSVAEVALEQGKRVGLITDSVIFDATPAAFVAHVESRYDFEEIARQMAASGVELLISHGFEAEDDEEGEQMEAVREIFTGAGYTVVTTWEDLQRLALDPTTPVLALLPADSIPAPGVPSLADVTDLALARLGGSPEGFFLLVETEETDTGGHDNDLPRVVAGVAALDAVAETAVTYGRERGGVLVVASADHETGGLLLQGGDADEEMPYRWITIHHTVLPVPVFAWGPGAERFDGVLDNTEIARNLSVLLGLEMFGEAALAETAEQGGRGEEGDGEETGAQDPEVAEEEAASADAA